MYTIDGPRSWICMVAAFFVFMIIGGLERSFGIWYIEIMENLEGSSAISAWITGINAGCRFILSPLVSMLCHRWSPHYIAMTGGLILGTSIFAAAWITDIYILLLAYGVVGGIGGAMIFLPPYVTLAAYFDKYKGLALAISQCGFGTGSLIFSTVFAVLFKEFSYFETLIVISAMVLHTIPAGAFFVCSFNSKKYSRINCKLITVPIVWTIMLTGLLFMLGSFSFIVMIVDFAVDRGIPQGSAALILTVCGALEVPTRLLFGLFIQLESVRQARFIIWSGFAFLTGIIAIATTYGNLLEHFMGLAVTNTATIGGYYSSVPIVLIYYFKVEVFSDILAFYYLGVGVGTVGGTFMAGHLKDMTSSYVASYWLMGCEAILASCFILVTFILILVFGRRRKWHLRSNIPAFVCISKDSNSYEVNEKEITLSESRL